MADLTRDEAIDQTRGCARLRARSLSYAPMPEDGRLRLSRPSGGDDDAVLWAVALSPGESAKIAEAYAARRGRTSHDHALPDRRPPAMLVGAAR